MIKNDKNVKTFDVYDVEIWNMLIILKCGSNAQKCTTLTYNLTLKSQINIYNQIVIKFIR